MVDWIQLSIDKATPTVPSIDCVEPSVEEGDDDDDDIENRKIQTEKESAEGSGEEV